MGYAIRLFKARRKAGLFSFSPAGYPQRLGECGGVKAFLNQFHDASDRKAGSSVVGFYERLAHS